MDLTENILLSKIEAIKNINANPQQLADNLYSTIQEDLPSTNGIIRRKIDDYQDARKAKKTSQKDIFEEIIKITNSFLSSATNDKNKLLRYAQESAKTTIRESKQIVVDTVKNGLFAGDGICGANKEMPLDSLCISPKEFDFLNMLTVSPDSMTGKIMYEGDTDTGFIKMNRVLYENFDSGEKYEFQTNNDRILFNIEWDATNQCYNVTGLQGLGGITGITQVQDFLLDYYASIEYPDIENVLKQSIYLAIQGDGEEPKTFTIGLDWLERLLQKLFSLCGSHKKDNQLDQNAIDESKEEDPEWYFNFEEIEGINLEDEDARARRVLKFADCDNFEIPINSNHQEDFVHFIGKKPIEENTTETLERIAAEANEQSEQTISLGKLEISIYGIYLKKIPKAIISAILSPKIFLPIAVLYKIIKNELGLINVKEIMKKLSRVFYQIIRKVFWRFIKNFWSLVKKDLLKFVKNLAKKIVLDKIKRWKTILTSLINMLLKILEIGIDSCEALFNVILETINAALNTKISIPIPGLLLAFSDNLPGFSKDKAHMNIVETLSAAGVPMGELYGRNNKLVTIVKGIVDGYTKEIDENGYVEVALKFGQVPITPAGVAVLTPQNKACGKFR